MEEGEEKFLTHQKTPYRVNRKKRCHGGRKSCLPSLAHISPKSCSASSFRPCPMSVFRPRRVRRHHRAMPMTTSCRTAAHTKRTRRIFPQRVRGTHWTTMPTPIHTAAAPRTAGSMTRMRTSSTMTGTTTARGMTTIISTIDTPGCVRCACVIAYTRGEFL